MASTKFTVLSALTCVFLAVTPSAHAQLGGLIKKKVGDAVKGPEKPKEKVDASPSTSGELEGLILDADSKKAFIAGLQVEIDGRAAVKKRLAALKTSQQFDQCKQQMLMNPEGQKFSQDYMAAMTKLGDNTANKKPEQLQKEQQAVAEEFTKRSKAMELKYCGEDPTAVRNTQYQDLQRTQDAGALEFGKTLNRRVPGTDDNARGVELPEESCAIENDAPFAAEGDAPAAVARCHAIERASRLASLLRAGVDTASDEEKKKIFSMLKELVDRYCQLSPTQKADAEKNGIKIPGSGQGIYWVFSKEFAQWVDGDCDKIKAMLAQLV